MNETTQYDPVRKIDFFFARPFWYLNDSNTLKRAVNAVLMVMLVLDVLSKSYLVKFVF